MPKALYDYEEKVYEIEDQFNREAPVAEHSVNFLAMPGQHEYSHVRHLNAREQVELSEAFSSFSE